MILEQIKGPEELKALPPEDLKTLAQEIRDFLIENYLQPAAGQGNLGCGPPVQYP